MTTVIDIVEKCAAIWDRRAMEAELAQASAKLVEQAAYIKELEAALLPFAEESKRFDDACENFNHPRMPDKHQPRTHFTHGQLRAARAAIENKNVW